MTTLLAMTSGPALVKLLVGVLGGVVADHGAEWLSGWNERRMQRAADRRVSAMDQFVSGQVAARRDRPSADA